MTTYNIEIFAEEIREMIRNHIERYYQRPTVLIVGEIYFAFLQKYAAEKLYSCSITTFEGLQIVKTRVDTVGVF
jgi:phosphoribosylformylglycinamidine (FGAM) synthase-like amidotransferase family enzyme